MTDCFLILNIGNRNILFDEDKYDSSKYNNISFTEFTKNCLDNESSIKITSSDILIPTLNEYKSSIKKIYLVGSDQSECENAKTDQDTIWAAYLLKRELEKVYDFEIHVIKNHVFATDVNRQIEFYLQLLKKIQEDVYGLSCILLDVGGTSQQKLALRKCCEFLIESDQLIILNKNIHQDKANIVYNDISFDLIKLEQIISLTGNGHFNSAHFICENLSCIKVPHLMNILTFCHFRFIQLSNNAIELCTPEKLGEAFYKEYALNYKSFSNGNAKMIKIISDNEVSDRNKLKKMAFEIVELFHLIKWQWYVEDLTSFILSLQQFIESLINCLITVYTGYDVYTDYYKNGNKLLENMQNKYPDVYEKLTLHFNKERINPSLPTFVIISEVFVIENYPEMAAFYNDLKTLLKSMSVDKQSKGIDQLRNAIAHEGKGVTLNNLNEILLPKDNDSHEPWENLIERWTSLFKLPQTTDYYKIANSIKRHIKSVDFEYTY